MSNNATYVTCNAVITRTGRVCGATVIEGRLKCAQHGGKSTGPKTPEGRKRCAAAKTVHGNETAEKRNERSLASARLAVLEMACHSLGMMQGTRTRGRKPNRVSTAYLELQRAVKGFLDRKNQAMQKATAVK